MPRFPRSVGTTDLVKLTGSEYPGLCLMTLICIKGLFTDEWMGSGNQPHQEEPASISPNNPPSSVLMNGSVVRLLPERQRLSSSSRAPAIYAIVDSYSNVGETYEVTHYNIQQRLRKETTETVSKDRVELVRDRWHEVRTLMAADEEHSSAQEKWEKESYNGWLLYCLIVGVPPDVSVKPPVPPTRSGLRIERDDPIALPVYYPQGSLHGLCIEEGDGNGSSKEVLVSTVQEGSLSMKHGVLVGDIIIDAQKTTNLNDPVLVELDGVTKSLEGIAVKGQTITYLRRVKRVFHTISKEHLQPTEFKVHGPRFASLLSALLSLDRMMSRKEYFESDVSSLADFIGFYQRLSLIITGPIRQTLSKCGACTGKFHAPTHIPRQIRLFGSPENVNGSYLEAALPHRVKKLARLTTRSHQRLERDVLERDYEMRLCEHSPFWATDNSNKDPKSSMAANPDHIFETQVGVQIRCGKIRFCCSIENEQPTSITAENIPHIPNQQWQLYCDGKRKASVMHPLAHGDASVFADKHVHCILQYAAKHMFTKVDFFVDLQVKKSLHTFQHAYRFHPSVYGNKESPNSHSAWYDWAVIDLDGSGLDVEGPLRCQYLDYAEANDRSDSHSLPGSNYQHKEKLPNCAIAQIGLGAVLSRHDMGDGNQHDLVVVLSVLMLKDVGVDKHIPLGLGGHLDETPVVIPAANLRREAFVVPAVDKLSDAFPNSSYASTYYVCIPPSNSWHEINQGFFVNSLDGRIWW